MEDEMDGPDGLGETMENFCEELTLQVCQICLRLRLTPRLWIHATTEIYRELVKHKPFVELVACPTCLATMYLLKSEGGD